MFTRQYDLLGLYCLGYQAPLHSHCLLYTQYDHGNSFQECMKFSIFLFNYLPDKLLKMVWKSEKHWLLKLQNIFRCSKWCLNFNYFIFFFILRWFLLRLLHISFRRMSSVKWRLCFISANKQKTRLLEINIALFYHWNW